MSTSRRTTPLKNTPGSGASTAARGYEKTDALVPNSSVLLYTTKPVSCASGCIILYFNVRLLGCTRHDCGSDAFAVDVRYLCAHGRPPPLPHVSAGLDGGRRATRNKYGSNKNEKKNIYPQKKDVDGRIRKKKKNFVKIIRYKMFCAYGFMALFW